MLSGAGGASQAVDAGAGSVRPLCKGQEEKASRRRLPACRPILSSEPSNQACTPARSNSSQSTPHPQLPRSLPAPPLTPQQTTLSASSGFTSDCMLWCMPFASTGMCCCQWLVPSADHVLPCVMVHFPLPDGRNLNALSQAPVALFPP